MDILNQLEEFARKYHAVFGLVLFGSFEQI